MKKSYKPSAFVLLVILFAAAMILPNSFGAKERIPWRKDFAAAGAEAARLNKPIFVEFTAGWCGYCRQMAHSTWADKDVAAALESTVPVQVDVDEHHDLASQYGVSPIPAYAVLDSKGNVVKFGEGYRSPEEFLTWLKEKPDSPTTQKGISTP